MNDRYNLDWSGPVKAYGRHVYSASPNADFWADWREDKEAVKAAGYRCRPGSDGGWVVTFEVSAPAAAAAPAAVAPAAVAPAYPAGAQVARMARRVDGFQAPELDDSRPWSDEQKAIFAHFRSSDRNLVVKARAGTGKTTTIRVAFSQAPEESMLYAVFNKKNQLEAQDLISDSRVDIKTLHALGYVYIRAFWSGVRPDDDVENYRAGVACGADCPIEIVGAVKQLVAFAKNCYVNPSVDQLIDLADARGVEVPEGLEDCGWNVSRVAQAALKALELSKDRDAEGRISFNDMVWLPVAKGWVFPKYDLVCVDEAQDMNLPQLLMAKSAVRKGGRVIVVGDDRQAIYGFRGAAQDGMAMMQRELNAVELGLTITYRCPKAIVAIASEYVKDYRAANEAPEGEVSHLSESAFLAQVQVGDAVLSRANAPLMPMCLGLLRRGISARIEGRDIGKMLAGLADKMRAKSVPHFIQKVQSWADKQKARALKGKHAETRCQTIEDQAATLVAVAEGATNVSEIISRLTALFQDTDGNSKPAVILSSVHKAKGLEWNRVALISATFKRVEQGGEEQNIYYVAVTRAKKSLVFIGEAPEKS